MSAVTSRMPDDRAFQRQLAARNRRGGIGQGFFLSAILVGLLVLVILLMSIINNVFGYVAVKESIHPDTLVAEGQTLESLDAAGLADILEQNLSKGKLQAMFLTYVTGTDVDRAALGSETLTVLLPNVPMSEEIGAKKFADLTPDELTNLIAQQAGEGVLLHEVYTQVVGREVLQSWSLIESIFNRGGIQKEIADRAQGVGLSPTLSSSEVDKIKAEYAAVDLEFVSWLNSDFFTNSISNVPADSGIRPALVGSLWILGIAILFAGPMGVGAAIYLEEYAKDSRFGNGRIVRFFNQFIEINIRNLAGVPSIIYGLLGLAIFANLLQALTSGQVFGVNGGNGRTVLTAGLTLGLLILPVIIINAQEAIRAVPNSIREASFGLGATKWQTISRQVIPAAIPGIMTGIILSLSRAIGETAPLVVVGAAVFLSQDPNGPFKAFTTLPIQVYNWASQPDDQFRNAASAAIIVLLALLLLLNATAIIVRQRFSRRLI